MRNPWATYVIAGVLVSALGVGCSKDTGQHAGQAADQAGATAESAGRDIEHNTQAAGRDLDRAGQDISETATRVGADVQAGVDRATDPPPATH